MSFYNKLKTGVVSGAMLWPEAVGRFKIVEVAPHMLKADLGAACSKAINVNANSWKKLPAPFLSRSSCFWCSSRPSRPSRSSYGLS